MCKRLKKLKTRPRHYIISFTLEVFFKFLFMPVLYLFPISLVEFIYGHLAISTISKNCLFTDFVFTTYFDFRLMNTVTSKFISIKWVMIKFLGIVLGLCILFRCKCLEIVVVVNTFVAKFGKI